MTTSLETFRELAADHTVVPVWRELVADLTTPVAAYARLCGDGPGFLLESVEHGERWSRYSFIGRNPLVSITKRDGVVSVDGDLPPGVTAEDGILALLEGLLSQWRAPVIDDFPPLYSGVMGYLGYDVVREVEHLPDVPADDTGLPDAMLSVIGEVAVYDHWTQRVTLVANSIVSPGADDDELQAAYDDAVARLDGLAADGARPVNEPMLLPPESDPELPEVRSSMTSTEFELAVETAKEHILAGDIFQVVLSQRFDFDLDAEPFDVYRVLRQINPSPYMYFVRQPEVTLVGCSPEPMVQLLDGKVISRPIAGTRRRGRTDEEDRRLGAELKEHPKEIAEHVMLVDLARNDVGRVVEFGSLELDEMMTLELYSHVMHMTSPGVGQPRRRSHAHRRPPGHAARGHRVRRPQGAGHGDHRRAGAREAGSVRGHRRLPGLLGEHRHRHRHPHDDHHPRSGVGAGRRGHRGRQRARPRGSGMPEQGASVALSRATGRTHDGQPTNRVLTNGVLMGDSELLPEIYRDGPAAALIARDVVTATGPDTEAFLQGQLSQDVAAMAVGDSAPSFLLQPMGKVDAWLRVTRTADDTFLLDVDAGHGEAMLTRLSRFKLRTKSDLTLETWTIKAVRADGREHDVVWAAGIEPPDGAVAVVGVDESWGPIAGHDILGPTCTLATDDREASAADFETLRVLAGVPAMGAELTEDTIPAEAGVVEQSVSFTKGCYTGQELVARIDSRGGNVPKHLRGVVGADELAVGAAVVIAGDEVGAITSAAGRVGLAYIKRAVDSFPVAADVGGVAADVRELPLV